MRAPSSTPDGGEGGGRDDEATSAPTHVVGSRDVVDGVGGGDHQDGADRGDGVGHQHLGAEDRRRAERRHPQTPQHAAFAIRGELRRERDHPNRDADHRHVARHVVGERRHAAEHGHVAALLVEGELHAEDFAHHEQEDHRQGEGEDHGQRLAQEELQLDPGESPQQAHDSRLEVVAGQAQEGVFERRTLDEQVGRLHTVRGQSRSDAHGDRVRCRRPRPAGP